MATASEPERKVRTKSLVDLEVVRLFGIHLGLPALDAILGHRLDHLDNEVDLRLARIDDTGGARGDVGAQKLLVIKPESVQGSYRQNALGLLTVKRLGKPDRVVPRYACGPPCSLH